MQAIVIVLVITGGPTCIHGYSHEYPFFCQKKIMVYTAQMAQRKGSIQGGKSVSELTRVPDSHASLQTRGVSASDDSEASETTVSSSKFFHFLILVISPQASSIKLKAACSFNFLF
jgi:hypothetical protein